MQQTISRLFLLGLLGAGAAPVAMADVIRGNVTDNSGDAPLQGAIVTIEELDRTATTDRFGAYTFNNVPAGDYTLSVSYIGASSMRQTVALNGEANAPFRLGDAVSSRESVLVIGQAAAQAGAINQQRASNAIISVIDSDGLGNFPDTTVADSLQRVPGLTIKSDQGEGRYVSIRGINTDLIGSSINGVRTPSPEDRRGVLLDGVPSDLLDTIEVQKSLTPNVDADSLGGIINLKTISAFDRDGQFIRAKLEGAYNDITEEWSPKGTFTYSNVFNDNLGVAFSLNYQNLGIESHNNEIGGWGEEDGLIVPNDDFEQRFYDIDRERLGLVVNVDYQLSDATELYFRSLYNRYVDDEVRNKWEFALGDFDISANGDIYTYDFLELDPEEDGIEPADAEVRLREEVRQIQTYSVGGVTERGPWSFNYEASYAYGEEDDSNNHDVTFRFDETSAFGPLVLDNSSPETPVFSGQGLADLQNPAAYELDSYEREFTVNEDSEWAAKFDVGYESFLGDIPVIWAGGIKFRDKEKTRDVNLTFHEPDLNMADFIRPDQSMPIGNWRLPNPMYNWPDADLTAALRSSLSVDDFQEDDSIFDSLVEDYEINEQILAGYGMGTFDFGALTLVAGVRVEDTQTDLAGNFFQEEDAATDVVARNFTNDFTHVLPSVNAKYEFTDRVIGRAAYYAAVVRPGFGEMAPFAFLNDDRDELELGNPNLDPYEADNFDISIEFYPTNLSVFSAGVFYKKIKNPIYGIGFEVDEDDLAPGNTILQAAPAGLDLSFLPASLVDGVLDEDADNLEVLEAFSYINVDEATVQGIEFNYVQQFDFLGAPFDGFLLAANLTLTDSEANLPDGREVPLIQQTDTVWNLSLGYDKGPWDIRVSANHRGDNLDELVGVDDGTVLDRYVAEHTAVEASVKYDVNPNLQVYVEGKNLTDEPEYYYFGNDRRLSQYDEFGWSAVVGARLTY